ncbi:MAG TPA: hypothetical protein PK530_22595 [Anaerolineales bacterium]|nr:hypothetical protein [Anaerolineales bacterium]
MTTPLPPLFDDDDLIFRYTRAEALADGALVDVTQTAQEAGFKFPVAITAALHHRLTPNAYEQAVGQSYDGRLWDVLFMASVRARRLNGSEAQYTVLIADQVEDHKTMAQHTLNLYMNIGPGDAGEPVITIGFPADF